MAVSLFTANEGYLDDVEVDKVIDFEHALQSYMSSEQAQVLDKINDVREYNEEIEQELHRVLKDFKANHTW